MTTAAIKKQIS